MLHIYGTARSLARLGVLMGLLFLAGCVPQMATPASPAGAPPPAATPTWAVGVAPTGDLNLKTPGSKGDPTCPGVQGTLLEVVRAQDPALAAQRLELRLQGSRLLVAIHIAGDETTFMNAYGVEVTGRAGQVVQAFVPLDRLCDLARDGQVQAISAPAAAVLH